MKRLSRSTTLRYAAALLSIVVATGLRRLLDPVLGDAFPFATLFFAVLVAAWYGGFGPAVAATLLGAVASAWLLLPPRDTLAVHGFENQAGLVLYLGVGLGIATLGGAMRAARQRAESAAVSAALQREELRTTLASIGDAVLVTDAGGRVVSLNPVAEALTGWPTGEAAGQPLEAVFDIVNEQTRQKVDSPVARVLKEGVVVGLANHTVLIAKGGAERPIDDSASPIKDAGGRLIGVVLVFRDVTERRAAEVALLKNEERLRLFVEHAPAAVAMLDREMRYLHASRRWLSDFGLGDQDVRGRSHYEVFPDLPARWKEVHRRCLAGEVERADEDSFTRPDGRTEWLRWEVRPWRDDRGEVGGIVIFTEVVTEQKVAQEVVREQARTLTGILTASVDHIYVVDREGRYTHVSAGGAGVLGFEPRDLTGKHWKELGLPADVMERFDAQRDRTLHDGQPTREEVVFRTPKGGDRHFEYVVAPIAGQDGRADAVVVVSRDVSERRRAEDRLRQSEQDLADFFDNATVGLHWVGPDGIVLRANRAELELLGYAGEEYVGRHIADFHADEDVICDLLKRLQAGEKIADYPARLRSKDGSIKDVLIDSSVLWKDGRFVHTRCFTRDVTERKLADAKVREQEQRTQTVLESITDAFCAFDRDWRFRYANRQAEVLLGRSRDDLIGKNHWEEYPDTLGTDVERNYRRAVAENVTVAFEFYYPTHDRWYELNAYPSPEGLSVYFRDVGDRKRAEIALRESEEKLRLLADTIPQLAWTARPDGHIFWYNRRWYEYTGTTPVEMEGWGWQSVHDPKELPRVLERWQASIASGEPFDMVFPLRGADGRFRPFLTRVNPLRGDGGCIRYWFGTNTDISEQKRAEADTRFLADSSATLAALVDMESTLQKVAGLAVPAFADWCAVDMLDEEGSLRRLAVAHVDPSKVELARDLHRRHPPDPAAPQGLWNILRTGKSEIVPEITDDLLAASITDADLLRVMRELGLKSYMGVPLSVRGKTLGVMTFIAAESGRRYDAADLAVAEDLAHRAAVAIENARLYQAVREADRRKDEFLALLGHELRNPLAPISNALQVLKLPGANGQVVERARDMMERQVGHMVRLVDDLLDVSRIIRGKVELRREPVELATVVARAVETSQSVIDAEGHRLSVALPDEPLRVDGDLVRLAQVVSNLLNNAAKYTERGGEIRLTAAREGGEAVLRVRDTGIGIAAELLPRLFDMFFQAERRTKESQGGLGIGLSLVRGIVELHGGGVEAHSDGPGRGSEFVVRLPSLPVGVDGGDRRGQAARQAEGELAPRRVLVVDDNVDAADSLAMLLGLAGQVVIVAYDGDSALAKAEADPPAIAFLDLGMPKMDGYELARRFRTTPALKGVVLVALTGWGQPEDRQRTKEAGFDHHLVKPVEADALHRLFTRRPDLDP